MKRFILSFVFFVCFLSLFFAVAKTNQNDQNQVYRVASPSVLRMAENRFNSDKDFKFFVELILIVGVASLFFGTFLTAVMGLRQSVLWSFVGTYFFVAVIEFFLILYYHFGSGGYDCLFALCCAFACSFFVYRKNIRDHGYGHIRFHF